MNPNRAPVEQARYHAALVSFQKTEADFRQVVHAYKHGRVDAAFFLTARAYVTAAGLTLDLATVALVEAAQANQRAISAQCREPACACPDSPSS